MTNQCNVTVISQGGKEIELSQVEVQISFPDAELYEGADGSVARIKRAGSLKIRTPQFEGWRGAELILVDEDTYEVSRSFSYPAVTDDWVVFPVMRR